MIKIKLLDDEFYEVLMPMIEVEVKTFPCNSYLIPNKFIRNIEKNTGIKELPTTAISSIDEENFYMVRTLQDGGLIGDLFEDGKYTKTKRFQTFVDALTHYMGEVKDQYSAEIIYFYNCEELLQAQVKSYVAVTAWAENIAFYNKKF